MALVVLVGILGGAALAETPEQRLAFDAALRTLDGGFAETAAVEFSRFVERHPKSPLAAEATLLEARARSQAGQQDAAAEVLTRAMDTLGSLQDQALYLLGDVHLQQSRFDEAEMAFRRLTTAFPQSPLALKASLGEAMAVFRGGNYGRASDLLTHQTNLFASGIASQPDHELAVPSGLLLAEALLRAGASLAAQQTLNQLTNRALAPIQRWDRQWLLTSLDLTNRQIDAALASCSNLLTLADAADSGDLRARTWALQGGILRQASRTREAFASFTNNLRPDMPAEWRRDALLAISELPLNPPEVTPAIQVLSVLAAGNVADPTIAAAQIAVAELHLQQHYGSAPSSPTHALAEARALLQNVVSNTPPSALQGRAWLSLGWTDLADGRLPTATVAFDRAAALLPPTPLQALALFKLADCEQQAGDHDLALAHYVRVIGAREDRPLIRGALLERALYQGTLAAIEAGQEDVAYELANRAIEEFPNGEFRDETRLLFGQTLARLDPPNRAWEALQNLATRLVNAPALPEIQLAVARSYLREGKWFNALQQLDDWTRSNPSHSGIAQAEFWRAWAAFKSGDETRAYGLFTNFLARFPDDHAAPQAQVWVGNHLYRLGGTNFVAAETSYQLVFQRTNWPVSRLTYEARLLAGRAAFARQGYTDAKKYFTWLIAHGPPAVPNSPIPSELVARAYFALGDCFIEEPEGSDRKLGDAMTAFDKVIQIFPESPEALLAYGKLADCYFQVASLDPSQAPKAFTNAAELYLKLMKPPADIATRSEAEVSLGIVREKQAARADGLDASNLLQQSLSHYLNVFNGGNLIHSGETASPFWVNRAGLEAARLSEAVGMPDRAARVYETLAGIFPASGRALRERAAHLRRR